MWKHQPGINSVIQVHIGWQGNDMLVLGISMSGRNIMYVRGPSERSTVRRLRSENVEIKDGIAK